MLLIIKDYSRSLCQSAICLRGELQTSFQWCKADPVHFDPPNSSLPITWNKRGLLTIPFLPKPTASNLIFGYPVPIQKQEFQTDRFQPFTASWNIKNETFVIYRTQRPLLHMRLLLGDSLSVVQQIDLDVRVCQSCDVHFGEVSGF